jgi:hypothetical protein
VNADEIRAWTAKQQETRRAYALEPFAGTRDLNQNDQARERMRATRAATNNKENPNAS